MASQNVAVLKETLSHFRAPIRYAFGYGSGVFQQAGYSAKSKPQTDFIFAVTHPQHWHSLNLQQNRSHYSFLGTYGSGLVANIQEKIGAGLYFNPYINIGGMTVKYGVVSIDTLCRDLLKWDTLYLAGRMHKPIQVLKDDSRIRAASQVNTANAVRVALLMLPKEFTEEELYMKIAGISYMGDFRMTVGENPRKIHNIVQKQMEEFHNKYHDYIEGLSNTAFVRDGVIQQDDNPKILASMIQKLPESFLDKVMVQFDRDGQPKSTDLSDEMEKYQLLSQSPNLSKYIATSVSQTVKKPAMMQSLKGIFTAGPLKSIKYAGEKLKKSRVK
ncbi:mitochondrial matrix Mmp37 [Basidiobolus meristosporus CBS 931.73]|uniref:Phosphatidate cytidylyltransferase, mitochondrial n=1 Tax=Basidiobolus meristosporus CBS 931.73 TaxID=1314790 RepID=A0A1Y1Y429_9FUNG|nr:mitochondrial matrix Mmp37 [Basidiobolus meristosporus CBS 931.73]|eukprot:ORX92781.1 mitochondrial matrix Mmp37 [Basidiobolus meristosporus CBS 931.73]